MFIALAVGQVLISQIEIRASSAFNIVVAIFVMALALVSLTRAEPPQITTASALPYAQLTQVSPIAVAGAAISGLIVGASTHSFRRGCRGEATTASPLGWLCWHPCLAASHFKFRRADFQTASTGG